MRKNMFTISERLLNLINKTRDCNVEIIKKASEFLISYYEISSYGRCNHTISTDYGNITNSLSYCISNKKVFIRCSCCDMILKECKHKNIDKIKNIRNKDGIYYTTFEYLYIISEVFPEWKDFIKLIVLESYCNRYYNSTFVDEYINKIKDDEINISLNGTRELKSKLKSLTTEEKYEFLDKIL